MSDLRVTFPNPCGERWEAMTPTGCSRACAKCDRVVHDLTQYDVAEVEKLMREEPDCCVRARVDSSGMIATKAQRHGGVRRMMTVVGASTGLLISPPAVAGDRQPSGAISGKVETFGEKGTATARDEKGNTYESKIRADGKYKIKHLPAGTYSVEFASECTKSWTVRNVVVADVRIDVSSDAEDGYQCIVVGLIKIEGGTG